MSGDDSGRCRFEDNQLRIVEPGEIEIRDYPEAAARKAKLERPDREPFVEIEQRKGTARRDGGEGAQQQCGGIERATELPAVFNAGHQRLAAGATTKGKESLRRGFCR